MILPCLGGAPVQRQSTVVVSKGLGHTNVTITTSIYALALLVDNARRRSPGHRSGLLQETQSQLLEPRRGRRVPRLSLWLARLRIPS